MSICTEIVQEIRANEKVIRKYFKVTNGRWEGNATSVINAIEIITDDKLKDFSEDYLTFILGCAYAINGNKGAYLLQKLLCEDKLPLYLETGENLIWFQFSPYKGRSSPKIDLAFGNINRPDDELTDETKSKIIYQPPKKSDGWICLVEMKILDDINIYSTDNPTFNQLSKYIRVATNIQKSGNFPITVHLTLCTPQLFRSQPQSRLYGYKFLEYASPKINPEIIISDIPETINHENFYDDWTIPDLNERLNTLNLHWISFEDILNNVPDSHIKDCIEIIRNDNPIFGD